MSPDNQDESKPPAPPEAAGDTPAGAGPAEPLEGEVSRTAAPGAGASAAPPAKPSASPPAPKPANPAAATTATTAETSSATGAPTETAQAAAKAPAAKPAAKPPEHKPAAAPTGPTDPAPPADAAVPGFIAALQSGVPGLPLQLSYWVGDWTAIVPADRLLEVARFLRDSPETSFDFCSDVTASDWPTRAKRFDLVYCLYSIRLRHRIRLKVQAGEGDPVPSVTSIWTAANWLEREVYDLFGVNIVGHPDLRRIMMPDEWQGHPQRKDYPLEGPGELLMESPNDWLQLRHAQDVADIE